VPFGISHGRAGDAVKRKRSSSSALGPDDLIGRAGDPPTGASARRVSAAAAILVPDISDLPADRTPLGELLVADDLIDAAALRAALSGAKGRRLGEVLVEGGLVDDSTLTRALGRQLRLPVVDLRAITVDEAATALITGNEAHTLDVLPYAIDDDSVEVVIADPLDPRVAALLRELPAQQVHISMAPTSHIRHAVNQTYSALNAMATDIDAFRADEVLAELNTAAGFADVDSNAPIVQVVSKLVTQALRDRVSDVHIEPNDHDVRVRFRIDGSLKRVMTLPAEMGPALVSRIKIMADMNIVERRRPQDGQFAMSIDGREVDIRVSTTCTIWGEKTVLRLLDRTRSLYTMADLGMPADVGAAYSRIVRSPFGMVIVSGPTGSGKTTTLYATLSDINREDINVMTIEDPVEYVFPLVNQIQISEQAGLTFATGLKSVLRQDPDVILVGEVRDVETARIAVQSALTGHLVLSSVHAIDSIAALYRLLDMGIEAFLVTSAVVGVVAQRLVRRICNDCAAPYDPTLEELAIFRKLGGGDKDVWIRGRGCALCADTGYYDRVGVYEVLRITDEVRQKMVDGRSPRDTREVAIEQGLRTLNAEAVRLVTADVTTIDEVVRNVFQAEDFE
jgi:type IV pilus assembly protein PilB